MFVHGTFHVLSTTQDRCRRTPPLKLPDKLKAVENAPTPWKVTELKSYLRLPDWHHSTHCWDIRLSGSGLQHKRQLFKSRRSCCLPLNCWFISIHSCQSSLHVTHQRTTLELYWLITCPMAQRKRLRIPLVR